MLWVRWHRGNNLWVSHLGLPISASLLLWAFSLWQERDVARLTFRLAIPLFIVVWIGLLVFAENLQAFSRYGSPLRAILLVYVAAYTLVTRSVGAVEPVWREDWFWVAAGTLVSYGTSAIVTPLANLLLATSPGQLRRMYDVFNGVDVIANLLVTWGMLCARPRPISGGSSWQRRSWRLSSPRRSSRR